MTTGMAQPEDEIRDAESMRLDSEAERVNCHRVDRLVSAAGLEPATHALKGHCSTN